MGVLEGPGHAEAGVADGVVVPLAGSLPVGFAADVDAGVCLRVEGFGGVESNEAKDREGDAEEEEMHLACVDSGLFGAFAVVDLTRLVL